MDNLWISSLKPLINILTMLKEWLLIIWWGTTTNFTVYSVHWSPAECAELRRELMQGLDEKFIVACVQDFREGRSRYPRAGAVEGIAK